jgi:hypothetical protein
MSTGLILVLPLDLKYTSLLFVSVWSDDFVLPAIDFCWISSPAGEQRPRFSFSVSSRPQLSWSQCSLRLLGFPLRRFLSSLKFFLFDFCPITAESRGVALCPASILVLKGLIFS